ncbi:nicotinamide mononucleotide transporter, partial [Arthrospira platensis SPKY1]|nr:nicotinamide mononucleotide transporter [Arthrospira platensis SPKY1]
MWLLIQRKRSCWIFGTLASALSIWLFLQVQLYVESLLYTAYVAFGVYGWWSWGQQANQDPTGEGTVRIQRWSLPQLLRGLLLASGSAAAL